MKLLQNVPGPARPRGASSAPKDCPFCHGDGECFRCQGTGIQTLRRGLFRRKRTMTCGACGGAMTCQLCGGSGSRPTLD